MLEAGIVMPELQKATLIFQSGTDRFLHQEALTDVDLAAYNAHPETFFGVLDTNAANKQCETQLDWFEFAYETYKNTSKAQLLEFMKDAPNFDELRELDQDDLAIRYCAGFARGVMANKS